MSLILQAPYPALTTTSVFPNPNFSDNAAQRHSVSVTEAMNGTAYSYVKSNARSKLNYTLTLSRMKALELRAFILAYYRAKLLLTNHKGETWLVHFTINPFDFTGKARAAGDPGDETQDITLEFEGTQVLAGPNIPCE